MNQTQKLLQSVVENARTGLNACQDLLKKAEDEGMRRELMTLSEQYQGLQRDAEAALVDAGARPHAQSPMGRAGMWMGIQMDTVTDRSPSHIADIAIQGATMGVISMTRDRADLPDADANAQGLASNFITTQQDAIERMKGFL